MAGARVIVARRHLRADDWSALVEERDVEGAWSTTTGDDGRYVLDGVSHDALYLFAFAAGVGRVQSAWDDQIDAHDEHVDVTLEPAAARSYACIDSSTGEPVEPEHVSAFAYAVPSGDFAWPRLPVEIHADDPSRVTITHASRAIVCVLAPGYLPSIHFPGDGTIEMSREASLTVRVVDVDDAPIEGARVRVEEPFRRSDEWETYQPVAKVIPRATAPLTPCASFPDLDESTDSPAIRRLAHDAIDTIAHESTSATGCYATLHTDAAGKGTLTTAAAGPTRFAVYAPLYDARDVERRLSAGAPVRVVLERTGRVVVHVRDADGRPVPASCFEPAWLPRLEFVRSTGHELAPPWGGARAVPRPQWIGPGTYEWAVSRRGAYRVTARPGAELEFDFDGEFAEVDLTLRREPRVSGVVTSADGPVAGAVVR